MKLGAFAVGEPEPPRLVASLVLAALGTLLICAPVWPGLMSFDSLFAYKQSIYGVETALWPPTHDYMFYVSRKLTGGPGGLFAGQIFVLFASAGTVIGMLARTSWRHRVAFAAFIASFFWFPTMLGTAIVNWKDVSLASFSLLAIGLWLGAVRTSSRTLIVLSAVSLGIAVSVRLNGLSLVVPFILLLLVQPTREPTRFTRTISCLAVVACLAGAYATTVWRLPDLRRLARPSDAFAQIQLWDLVGASACAGQSLLPASFQGSGALNVAELRGIYDPKHINLTMHPPAGAKPLPIPSSDVSPDVRRAWGLVIRHHLGCYLQHRALVFAYLLGVTPHVFYPTHSGIDDNPYGIRFRHPWAASRQIAFVLAGADQWLRRPIWLYLMAIAAIAVVFVRRRQSLAFALMLGIGAVLYLGSFFFFVPAGDARYIFPSNVFCALLCAVALAAVGQKSTMRAEK